MMSAKCNLASQEFPLSFQRKETTTKSHTQKGSKKPNQISSVTLVTANAVYIWQEKKNLVKQENLNGFANTNTRASPPSSNKGR